MEDCVTGYFCENGSCKTQKEVGSTCLVANECATGYCVDGVCCQSACDGVCRACSAAKKGGGKDGLCDAVASDTDPDNDCNDDGKDSCKQNGLCDGAGECALYPNKTQISASQCVGDNGIVKQICDGKGKVIIDSSQSSCGAYRCDSAKNDCFFSCTSTSQCTGVYACINGNCLLPAGNNQPCTLDDDCSSKHCVSGFCCNEACSDTCESCRLDAAPGTCLPIPSGVDPDGGGPKAKCNGNPNAPACQGYCNGTERQCFYPGTSTICGSACVSAVQTPYACNNNGECIAQTPTPCDPYACDSVTKKCKENGCATDDDCAKGARCDTTAKQCVQASAMCAGPFSIKAANGSEQSCKGYLCLDGSGCRDTCDKPNECDTASGYSCQNGQCRTSTGSAGNAGSTGSAGASAGGNSTAGTSASQGGAGSGGSAPAEAAASDTGGCGCETPGRAPAPMSGLWLVSALAVVARRRRRIA
jgi:MYXO-CTERM domain-containing protein